MVSNGKVRTCDFKQAISMSKNTYGIKKSFLVPLFVDIILLSGLISVFLSTGGSPVVVILLFVIFIPFLFVFIELVFRRISLEQEGIKMKTFFKNRELKWQDITNVDSMTLYKKVYLLLTTTKGFFALSNSYGNFTSLTENIAKYSGAQKVEENVRHTIEHPLTRICDVATAWFSAFIISGILLFKTAF